MSINEEDYSKYFYENGFKDGMKEGIKITLNSMKKNLPSFLDSTERMISLYCEKESEVKS